MTTSSLQIDFFTFIGAFTLYLLNRLKSRSPFSLFAALNIDVGKTAAPLLVFSDMVLSSALGTCVVVALTSPRTVPQAVLVGLGVTGVLSAHAATGVSSLGSDTAIGSFATDSSVASAEEKGRNDPIVPPCPPPPSLSEPQIEPSGVSSEVKDG